MRHTMLIFTLVVLIIAAAGCNSGDNTEATPTPTSLTSTSPTSTSPTATSQIPTSTSATPTTTGGARTFGQLADAGVTVFASRCAGCHGNQGQGGSVGPAIIGVNAGLDNYATAQGLLDFISAYMPQSAPGSLPHEEYLNVLGFLLVRNDLISPAFTFEESKLQQIPLE